MDRALAADGFRSRFVRALRARQNWLQLLKFSAVGGSGVVVNLVVFAILVHGWHMHYLAAAACSFLVAVTNNYTWNHLWTFRGAGGKHAYQGPRFLVVSVLALALNLVLLRLFVSGGLAKVQAQAVAILLVTPVNFLGNKLWSFRRRHHPQG